MKILLVDDELKFVKRLAERLNIRGFDADWSTSGEDALKKAESEKYELAVLDVKMPNMSGLELRKELAKKNPDMDFILVTGHGSEQDYMEGSKEASFYILKPFQIDTLVEKINEVMESSGK